MPTKVLLCDTGDWVVQLHYALLKSDVEVEIDAVTDVFRALDAAARTSPDVVVTDIDLDGLPGVELIRRLKAIAPRTRVVCWSTVSTPDTVAEMYAAGASAYLLKEDGPSWVARAVRSVMDGNVTIAPSLAGGVASRVADSERQQRRLERALEEVTGRLEQLTTAKAEFLANVSHELRTPVTVARAIAHHLTKRTVSDAERADFLDKLETALQKLTALVDDMLTIADLDRGNLSLQLTEVDLASMLHEIATDVSRHYPVVTIERTIPDVLAATADPGRIREVARQLLDNACRYSPEGAVVQLRARAMAEGAVVSVTDRGHGVQRRVVTQAFNEPFSTGEEILRKERAGLGLGLHLARQIVLQHGGIIWADPIPAGGTRVSFCIPFDREHVVTERPVLPVEPIPQGTASGASS